MAASVTTATTADPRGWFKKHGMKREQKREQKKKGETAPDTSTGVPFSTFRYSYSGTPQYVDMLRDRTRPVMIAWYLVEGKPNRAHRATLHSFNSINKHVGEIQVREVVDDAGRIYFSIFGDADVAWLFMVMKDDEHWDTNGETVANLKLIAKFSRDVKDDVYYGGGITAVSDGLFMTRMRTAAYSQSK